MADYSDYGGVPFLQNYDQHESNTASSLQDHGNTSSQVVKAQNMAAFQQNSMLPPVTSLQPSTAQNQAHINSLLQQLQAAGYTLPPMAPQEASQSGQNVPLPQPSHNATNGTPLGSNSRGRIGDLRSDREEGELSETDMTSSPAGRSGYAAPRTNAADVSRMPGNGNNNYRPRYDRNDSNGSFPGQIMSLRILCSWLISSRTRFRFTECSWARFPT